MKTLKIVSFLAFFMMLFLYLNFFSSFVMPWQNEEAMDCILIWGGLHEIPKDAEITNLRKYGSMFTRQFKIEFTSSHSEIKKWILESKSLKNNKPEIENGIKVYNIHPGELTPMVEKLK